MAAWSSAIVWLEELNIWVGFVVRSRDVAAFSYACTGRCSQSLFRFVLVQRIGKLFVFEVIHHGHIDGRAQ